MADLNEVMFTGRIGKDSVLSYTQAGKPKCTATFAVNSISKDKAGQVVKTPTWYTLVGWEKTAEIMAKLKKGMAVMVKGSLQLRKYVNKESEAKEYLELTVRRVDLLDFSLYGEAAPGFSEENLADEEPAF